MSDFYASLCWCMCDFECVVHQNLSDSERLSQEWSFALDLLDM